MNAEHSKTRPVTGHPPIVWVFAGLDPSGGAGVLLDARVIATRGAWPMAIVTTSTVQSSAGLRRSVDVDASLIEAQADTLLEDGLPTTIKIGALGGPDVVRAVSGRLQHLESLGFEGDVVWDPVVQPTQGSAALTEDPLDALRKLGRFATLITPNRSELGLLLGDDDPRTLLQGRTRALIITGGESRTATDTLLTQTGTRAYRGHKAPFTAHGTGCALSSCLAAELARGIALPRALGSAKQFVGQALHTSWTTEGDQRVLNVD